MTFCTVINYMDGRTQLPVNEYLRLELSVDFVDTITEAAIKFLDEKYPQVQILGLWVDSDWQVVQYL